jgi:biotin carboxyl carrier protein
MACPVGTIHSRLAWARERLRTRLTRRGVTLATAGLTALLAHGTASAVPLALAETTLQAAFAYAAHSVTAAGVSASAVALTKGVLRTMFLAKLKLGAAVVMALALCGGIGGLTYYHMAETAACPPPGTPNPAAASNPAPQPAPPAQAVRTIKVPSQVDGTILFLATELKPGEVVPKDKKIVEKSWTLGILTVKEAVEDRLIVEDAVKSAIYRKWRAIDGLPPKRLRVGYVEKKYRKLVEGDKVEKGQLLALVDTEIARDELESKIAKIDAAQSELQTSTETKKEAEQRYNRIRNANIRSPGTFAPEEESGALLTWQKYVQEELAKAANLVSAQKEANRAITMLKKHEIQAPVAGEIKVIRVQVGEAVKRLETVLEILPIDERK